MFRAPCLAFINSQKSRPLTYTKVLMPCLNLSVILPYSIGYCGCERAPGDMFAVILPYQGQYELNDRALGCQDRHWTFRNQSFAGPCLGSLLDHLRILREALLRV
jgi:hypothetical protein